MHEQHDAIALKSDSSMKPLIIEPRPLLFIGLPLVECKKCNDSQIVQTSDSFSACAECAAQHRPFRPTALILHRVVFRRAEAGLAIEPRSLAIA